ncbi:hypothetical protein pEaSNUABM12_00043 [Erwinia phage pEa_SNUABM_12]|uniref:Uncharacterized protein n=1 Tax=Erwinia phage pEa_SNUABM_12 TaxID=2768773 RepID=A0A7L8ZM35_9CAUD|nr:hypothetical protein pEaSNUABM12_00043 [Erwinia phage pEa_SNUABM_12]
MEYEKIKEMFLKVWPILIPLMPPLNQNSTPIDNEYFAEYITFSPNHIFRIYGNGGTKLSDILFEISYNTETKYFSTFTEDTIRIAHWKKDLPRFYALHDPDNSKENGQGYTFIQYPCDTDYFFQRMTVQNTLEYEEYELWDTEVMVMQEVLSEHPALSIGLVLRDEYLTPDDVIKIGVEFFEKMWENKK